MGVRVKDDFVPSRVLPAVFAQHFDHPADAAVVSVTRAVQMNLSHVERLVSAVDIHLAAVVEPKLRLQFGNIGHVVARRHDAVRVTETAILDRQPERLEHKSRDFGAFQVFLIHRFKNARLQDDLRIGGVNLFRSRPHQREMLLVGHACFPDACGASEKFQPRFHNHTDVVVERVAHGDPLCRRGVREIILQYPAGHGAVKVAFAHSIILSFVDRFPAVRFPSRKPTARRLRSPLCRR